MNFLRSYKESSLAEMKPYSDKCEIDHRSDIMKKFKFTMRHKVEVPLDINI